MLVGNIETDSFVLKTIVTIVVVVIVVVTVVATVEVTAVIALPEVTVENEVIADEDVEVVVVAAEAIAMLVQTGTVQLESCTCIHSIIIRVS